MERALPRRPFLLPWTTTLLLLFVGAISSSFSGSSPGSSPPHQCLSPSASLPQLLSRRRGGTQDTLAEIRNYSKGLGTKTNHDSGHIQLDREEADYVENQEPLKDLEARRATSISGSPLPCSKSPRVIVLESPPSSGTSESKRTDGEDGDESPSGPVINCPGESSSLRSFFTSRLPVPRLFSFSSLESDDSPPSKKYFATLLSDRSCPGASYKYLSRRSNTRTVDSSSPSRQEQDLRNSGDSLVFLHHGDLHPRCRSAAPTTSSTSGAGGTSSCIVKKMATSTPFLAENSSMDVDGGAHHAHGDDRAGPGRLLNHAGEIKPSTASPQLPFRMREVRDTGLSSEGTVQQVNGFHIGAVLGKGRFTEVREMHRRSEQRPSTSKDEPACTTSCSSMGTDIEKAAVKIYCKKEAENVDMPFFGKGGTVLRCTLRDRADYESLIATRLGRHENIVRLLEIFDSPDAVYMFHLFELVSNGQVLYDIIPEREGVPGNSTRGNASSQRPDGRSQQPCIIYSVTPTRPPENGSNINRAGAAETNTDMKISGRSSDKNINKGTDPLLMSSSSPTLFTAAAALSCLRQLQAAAAHLHSRGIVHKDIKPENVLVEGCFEKDRDFYHCTTSSTTTSCSDGAVSSQREDVQEDVVDFFLGQFEVGEGGRGVTSAVTSGGQGAGVDGGVGAHGRTRARATQRRLFLGPAGTTTTPSSCLLERKFPILKLCDFNSAEILGNPPQQHNDRTRRGCSTCTRTSETDVVAEEGQQMLNKKIYASEGTMTFRPPEGFLMDEDEGIDGTKRDLWSVGVLLYCMCFGVLPVGRVAKSTFELQMALMQYKGSREREDDGEGNPKHQEDDGPELPRWFAQLLSEEVPAVDCCKSVKTGNPTTSGWMQEDDSRSSSTSTQEDQVELRQKLDVVKLLHRNIRGLLQCNPDVRQFGSL